MKTGEEKTTEKKDHQDFFNDKTLDQISQTYDKIKPNSKAGEYKQKIDKYYKDKSNSISKNNEKKK